MSHFVTKRHLSDHAQEGAIGVKPPDLLPLTLEKIS